MTACALILAGDQARREHRSADARKLFIQAAELAGATGDDSAKVDALRGWANSEGDLGQMDAAYERYEEATAILRRMDAPQPEPGRLAHKLRHLADVARQQGRNDLSRDHYEEAVKIYRADAGTSPLDLADALRGYGLLLEALGEPGATHEVWVEVLQLYTAVGVPAGIAEAEKRVSQLRSTGS